MQSIPRDRSFDSTWALLRDPYRFISKRCRRHESDLFETRLQLKKTICMTGPEAARLFYDSSRFIRRGAMPQAIQRTLLGEGGVQGLDDESHRRRKQMFMSLMTSDQIEQLVQRAAAGWQGRIRVWSSMREVVLYTEIQELLTRAACAWAGVPVGESEIGIRTREIAALFDHAGSVGFRHLWSRTARNRVDHWMEDTINLIRSRDIRPPVGSAAYIIAHHRELSGQLLAPRVAAVELINVIRPTVAVSVYIVLLVHALHAHPELRRKLATGDDGYTERFVQEVRRYYPFFPAVAARVRQTFEWNGYLFPRDRRVMLDLYGTNHDPRAWNRPEEFEPERFRRWDGSPFNFVPQGGGDHHVGHRCPGEWIAIALMKQAAEFFTRSISYEVPDQNLQIEWSRMPALPKSRFVISKVRESNVGEG